MDFDLVAPPILNADLSLHVFSHKSVKHERLLVNDAIDCPRLSVIGSVALDMAVTGALFHFGKNPLSIEQIGVRLLFGVRF